MSTEQTKKIRNTAIIAHVDHGKTTLVDGLLRQSGVFQSHEHLTDRVMDSNDLEKERGITILAKNTAVHYNGYKINIVDTPGHADFGGEVERVLGMVDSALLVVDAFDGPMPQTRFVLRKALEQGLIIIVVINKIDRQGARPDQVLDMVLDLFIELGADEDQLDFPYVYASALGGFAKNKLEDEDKNFQPLFDMIVNHSPAPIGDETKPLQLQVTTLDYSEYLGRIIIGRIQNGIIKSGQMVALLRRDGTSIKSKVTKLFGFEGLKRIEVESAIAGDIVAVAGLADANIGETLADPDDPHALPLISIDEPTVQMTFCVNDSPFCGKEGKFVTSRHLRDRLTRELQSNVSLRVEDTDTPEALLVSGRGELHLGILIETMRREGYELQVSRPQVIFKEFNDAKHEPFEHLVLDIPDEYVGPCIERLGTRYADMQNMVADGNGRTMIEFLIPSRGLFGFRSDFLRMTRGEGMMHHVFHSYQAFAGDIHQQRNGVLVAFEDGDATAYAIQNLEDRGAFFIAPGTKVYAGMIVGENNRPQDLDINVCRTKKLTNMRAAGADDLVRLTPPIQMTLERAIEYIEDDELVEITPKGIRLRKKPQAKRR